MIFTFLTSEVQEVSCTSVFCPNALMNTEHDARQK